MTSETTPTGTATPTPTGTPTPTEINTPTGTPTPTEVATLTSQETGRAEIEAESRITRLLTWFHQAPGQPRLAGGPQPSWRHVLPVAILGFLAATVLVALRAGWPGGVDATAPFLVGSFWGLDEALAASGISVTLTGGTYGYDGQWFLALAYDPLLRTDLTNAFDMSTYRAQRPLFPMLGWLLALGQTGAIPYALLAVEALAVALGCAACARVLAGYGRSRWWGLIFAAIPGVLVGVMFGTAEPVGLALAALGLSYTLSYAVTGRPARRHLLWAGLAFAGAGLTKENYLVFAVMAAVYLAVDGHLRGQPWIRPASLVALPGLASFAMWWGYVQWTLPPPERTATQVFTAPLVGWWQVSGTIARGEYVPDFPVYWGGPVSLLASGVLMIVAVALAVRRRQSLLAYCGFAWGVLGLALEGFLLERFLSAHRALGPAVLATALLVIAVGWSRPRRRPAPDPAPRQTG